MSRQTALGDTMRAKCIIGRTEWRMHRLESVVVVISFLYCFYGAFITRKFNIRFVQYWCYRWIFYAVFLLLYYKVLDFTRVWIKHVVIVHYCLIHKGTKLLGTRRSKAPCTVLTQSGRLPPISAAYFPGSPGINFNCFNLINQHKFHSLLIRIEQDLARRTAETDFLAEQCL